jgi:hypothetical protein
MKVPSSPDRDWFSVIGVISLLLVALAGAIIGLDPIRTVTELHGSVVSWNAPDNPKGGLSYYRALVTVKADDGRQLIVISERRTAPSVGTRVTVQERVGVLGTRKFIELVVD